MKLLHATFIICFGLLYTKGFTQHNANINLYQSQHTASTPHFGKAPTDSIRDILNDVNFINNAQMPAPSKKFRPGHVTEASLNNYYKKTDYGFIINMQSSSNVPTPAISNGNIFVSGGFGSKKYFAFDAVTGQKKWAKQLDDDGPSSAAIAHGTVVFNTESCTIFACDEKTGEHKWSYWLGDPLMSMPSIANNQVFTSYPAHYTRSTNESKETKKRLDSLSFFPSHVLISFDLTTGAILWQKWIDGDIMSAPVVEGENLYFSTFSGSLFKVNQKTGAFISAQQTRATSAPIITNGNLYLARRADKFGESAQESIATMDLDGKFQTQDSAKAAPYLDHKVQDVAEMKTKSNQLDAGNGFGNGAPSNSGVKYAKMNIGQSNVSSLQSFQGSRTLHYKGNNYNTQGNRLYCSNAENGDSVWTIAFKSDMHKKGGFMATPPLEVNGKLIVATLQGEIFIINAKTGLKEKTYVIKSPIRYQPVVSNGWIYVTTTNGQMAAINTKNKQLTGWPMWGGNAARTNESM